MSNPKSGYTPIPADLGPPANPPPLPPKCPLAMRPEASELSDRDINVLREAAREPRAKVVSLVSEMDQLRKENDFLKIQVNYLENLVHDLKRARRIIDAEMAKPLSPEGVQIVSGLEGFADHLDNGGTVDDWQNKTGWPFRKGRGRGKGY